MKKTAVMMMIISDLCFLPACLPHIYHLVERARTWTEARTYCRSQYTDLAVVHNEQDWATLSKLTEGLYSVWIGLQADTESWGWSLENQDYYGEGEAEFRMWNVGELNGTSYYKVCAAMLGNGSWADLLCNSQYSFFCYNKNSSGFIFVNVSKTWDDAQSYCRKYHTDLASVRNKSENEKLRKMMVDSFTWIGLYRNSWKWSDGSAYSFTRWAPNNPSLPVTAWCGTILGGKWFNIDCRQQWYFVCYTVVKQRNMLKVELKKTDTSADMDELNESILEKFSQKLNEQGLNGNINLIWVKKPDGSLHKNDEQVEEGKEESCGIK